MRGNEGQTRIFSFESVLCVLLRLVRPDRALRIAAENGLNHFDLAVPDLEHVHIGQPAVEVHKTGCNSGFDIGNREAPMRVRHVEAFGRAIVRRRCRGDAAFPAVARCREWRFHLGIRREP